MVGAGAGLGFHSTRETNDFSNPAQLQAVFANQQLAGIGDTAMEQHTDAFFIQALFQYGDLDFAQIVTPATEDEGVYLTVGVLGGDEDRNPLPFDQIFGLHDPIEIPFFAQPCDFDSNGHCDSNDLEQLNLAVASGAIDPLLNVDGSDPPKITVDDVEVWHHLSQPIPGDSDYDGDVDVVDLNNVGIYWGLNTGRFADGVARRENGDLNNDGKVDVEDLNLIGLNWQTGVAQRHGAVPETSHTFFTWFTRLLVWCIPGLAWARIGSHGLTARLFTLEFRNASFSARTVLVPRYVGPLNLNAVRTELRKTDSTSNGPIPWNMACEGIVDIR